MKTPKGYYIVEQGKVESSDLLLSGDTLMCDGRWEGSGEGFEGMAVEDMLGVARRKTKEVSNVD